MTFYVGTSGFSYKEWKGPFYPEGLKDREMLGYYASRLTAVEINNTFYRMPKRDVIRAWAAETPPGFRFVIKASRRITHFKRLKDPEELLGYLITSTNELGDHLGAILFQLPPNMRADVGRLREFARLLPEGTRAAMDFRHESWFTDEVYQTLSDHNMAICHADDEETDFPFVPTADWGYLRLRRADYQHTDLEAWARRADEAGFQHCHVFFKHEDEGAGPNMALEFQDIVGAQPDVRTA